MHKEIARSPASTFRGNVSGITTKHSPLPNRCAREALTFLLAAFLTGCASLPPMPYAERIEIVPALAKGLNEYASAVNTKAFAGARDGAYGYGYAGNEANQSVRTALAGCQRESRYACRVLDINGQSFQDTYLNFSIESRKALSRLSLPSDASYDLEAADWGLFPPTQMRFGKRYHGPTPKILYGIRTIATRELAELAQKGQITLIDTRGWFDPPMQTLPNAYVIDWAGSEDGNQGDREAILRWNFAQVMQLIEPDKTRPVAVFCVSAECWLSINAAFRLQALGYTNILWYRGGINSWTAAKLPTVTAVPHATIWSPKTPSWSRPRISSLHAPPERQQE